MHLFCVRVSLVYSQHVQLTLSWAISHSLVYYVSLSPGQLSITLQEPDNVLNRFPVRLQLLDGSRSFSLVPGRTYTVNCLSMMGFEGSMVWLDGNEEPIPVLEPDQDPPSNTTQPYARLTMAGSMNEWSLLLQNFNENMVGTYICRRTEEEQVTLTIELSE